MGIFSHYVQNYNHLMRPKLISEFIEECLHLSRNNLIIRFYIDTKYLASLFQSRPWKKFELDTLFGPFTQRSLNLLLNIKNVAQFSFSLKPAIFEHLNAGRKYTRLFTKQRWPTTGNYKFSIWFSNPKNPFHVERQENK